ncbi:MAG: OmpA family protein [Polyangiales bacterium]
MFPSDDGEAEGGMPVYAAFSDLLACVLGIFVLFFAWVVSFEVSMAGEIEREHTQFVREHAELEQERAQHLQATERLRSLEAALAGPVREGLITFVNGTIGIRGSVLFDSNSAQLRGEGGALLRELSGPLGSYLGSRDEVLMVSGFTDDLQIRFTPQSWYRDNWELSVQRSVTVVRSLVDAGIPAESLFAAGFAHNHPVVPNDNEANRAKNRRVELAPVPRPRKLQLAAVAKTLERQATPGAAARKNAKTAEGSAE